MLQLMIMLVWLVCLSAVCIKFTKGALLSPQLAFVACFIPQVAYAFLFVDYWSLDLAWQTVATVLGGCTLFAAVSFAVSLCFDICHAKRKQAFSLPYPATCGISNCTVWHAGAFLLLQIITVVWTFAFLLKATDTADISQAIITFNDTNKFSDTLIELPGLLGKLRMLTFASGFVWAYMLIYSFAHKIRIPRVLVLLNFVMSVVNSLTTGSRTDAFLLIVATVVMAYFIYGRKNEWKLKMSPKKWLMLGGGAAALVLSFQTLGNLLGRNSKISVWEYIGIYLSAELKNLDIFIREGQFGAPVGQWQTLINLVNMIARRFNIPEWTHKFDIPFRNVNGHSLGNVATTFYAWLYDGGYIAVIIFTVIMAVICQLVYKFVTCREQKAGRISISELAYSYILFTVAFSFFSNKFYEHIFSGYFVYMLVFFAAVKLYVEWFSIANCKKLFADIKNRCFKKGAK